MVEWRQIAEFPGYDVNTEGIVIKRDARKEIPTYNSNGYSIIQLKCCGKPFMRKLHRIIAMAFIENPDNKPFVDHIDTNRQNNSISNLRWATNRENQQNRRVQSTFGHNIVKTSHGKFRIDIYVSKGNVIVKTFTLQTEAVVFRDRCLNQIRCNVHIEDIVDKSMVDITTTKSGKYYVDIRRNNVRTTKTIGDLEEAKAFRDSLI